MGNINTTDTLSVEDNNRDLQDKDEKLILGSIVSTYAHPYQLDKTNIIITAYNHFTPPLMVVVEKKYSITKYNPETGGEEIKDGNNQCRCIYYCTQSGSLTENWFKESQLRLIDVGSVDFLKLCKNHTINELNEYIGELAILTTVDFELGKKQTWQEQNTSIKKRKTLLDFLPPLGTIIDFKFNEDHKKFNEKNGKPLYRKSKLNVKLRWWNNQSSKYSEEYFPIVALKLIKKDDLALFTIKSGEKYKQKNEVLLENNNGTLTYIPIEFIEVIWKHYQYIYSFKNIYTNDIIELSQTEVAALSKFTPRESKITNEFFSTNYVITSSENFFTETNKANFENKWFEFQYIDRANNTTKRIVFVDDKSTFTSANTNPLQILSANCLLRNGEIRHFNVARILNFKEVPSEFVKEFLTPEAPATAVSSPAD